MFAIAKIIISGLSRICRGGRTSRALRELELLDQSMLNDLGMSRAALVGRCHGRDAGQCAAF